MHIFSFLKAKGLLSEEQLKARNDLKLKVATGKYNFENIDCPICSSKDRLCLVKEDRYELSHQVGICRDCSFIYAFNRLDGLSANDFYKNEFAQLDSGFNKGYEHSFRSQYLNAKFNVFPIIKDSLKESINSSFSVLEVGCSSGGLLSFMKEKGAEIYGIDLDYEAINFANKKKGLSCDCISIESINRKKKYDLIILISALEHIHNIRSFLEIIDDLLKDNSLLFIRVPGLNNLKNNYFHRYSFKDFVTTPHLYYFTEYSLSNLLNQFGFKPIYLDPIIYSLFKKNKKKKIKYIKDSSSEILKSIKLIKESESIYYRIKFLLMSLYFLIRDLVSPRLRKKIKNLIKKR